MSDTDQYSNDYENKWCPGCGNFGILNAIKESLADMQIPPEKLLMISGIGQAAKTPHFLRCNFFHGLHERALPVATGAKLMDLSPKPSPMGLPGMHPTRWHWHCHREPDLWPGDIVEKKSTCAS
jgi:pyruvate/2-oxoacid:ferredoxin oxidoreductase beta subunit